ncbi:MAG: glycosyltransferase family 9 protein [Calditerrivibrio sp.]|nr:glycosyltransferase family 9 protein [Calditerrivibrio sp.]
MRILIIQIRQLGDVLLSSNVVRVIKKYLPESRVDFLTSKNAASIVSANPFIDNLLLIEDGLINEIKTIFKVRKNRYDAVIDIQRTGRSGRITFFSGSPKRISSNKRHNNFYYNVTIDSFDSYYTLDNRIAYLKGIGVEVGKGNLPEMYVSIESENSAKNFMEKNQLSDGKYFIVAPTSRRPERSWSGYNFGVLTNMIVEKSGLVPVLLYAPNEKEVILDLKQRLKDVNFVDTEGKLSFQEIAVLIKRGEFFIGNDSFLAHLSVSQQQKTFILVGPNSGWFPEIDFVHEISAGLPCQPCNRWTKCSYDRIDGRIRCFSELNVEMAYNSIIRYI